MLIYAFFGYYLLSLVILKMLKLTITILKQVLLCGEIVGTKKAVAQMAAKLGIAVVDKESLLAAQALDGFPLQLSPEWRMPLQIDGSRAVTFFSLYLMIRNLNNAYV